MAEPSITLIIPSAAVGGLLTFAVQAALRWFNGKGDKPSGKPSPCEGCRFHADHETRIRALEAHRARMEESIPDIRDDLRELKGMINSLLLRFGVGNGTP